MYIYIYMYMSVEIRCNIYIYIYVYDAFNLFLEGAFRLKTTSGEVSGNISRKLPGASKATALTKTRINQKRQPCNTCSRT